MSTINIMSLNIRGLNDEKKRRKIFRWLENNKCDILLFQETFAQKEFPKSDAINWVIKHNLSNSSHSRGVAIGIHNKINFNIQNIHKRNDARAILINVTIENTDMTICNIYAPTDVSQRKEFFNNIKNWIIRFADHPDNIVIGGDFNCAINDNDRVNKRGNIDNSRKNMEKLLKDLKMTDTWYIHNTKLQYTYTDPESGSKSRIDYIFISKKLEYKVKKASVKHVPQKDRHKAVILNIKIHDNKKGPGTWKLNAKLLEMPEHDLLMDNILKDLQENFIDLNGTLRWELMKIKAQEGSIKLGIERAKKQKEYVNNLQKNIDNLSRDEDSVKSIDINLKNEYTKKLEQYYKEKDDGYRLRSKMKWVNEGEKSTKYFYNLEKSRQSTNVIRQLKNPEGLTVTSDKEIIGECTNFYDNLFTTRNISQETINNYLKDVNFNKILSENEKMLCDQEITEREVSDVIKNLKTEKSPGCDGLTPEFYKKYWPKIKGLYMEMVRESYNNGELPYTLRKAILALLFKKGDTDLLKV